MSIIKGTNAIQNIYKGEVQDTVIDNYLLFDGVNDKATFSSPNVTIDNNYSYEMLFKNNSTSDSQTLFRLGIGSARLQIQNGKYNLRGRFTDQDSYLDFDGVNDYVDVSDTIAKVTNEYKINMKASFDTLVGDQILLRHNNESAGVILWIRDGDLQWWVRDQSANWNKISVNVNINQIYDIEAYINDSTDSYYLKLDGVTTTGDFSGKSIEHPSSTSQTYVGKQLDGAREFNGQIYDLSIETDINGLYDFDFNASYNQSTLDDTNQNTSANIFGATWLQTSGNVFFTNLLTSTSSANTNKNQHIAITYDTNNGYKMYVNGLLEDSETDPRPFDDVTGNGVLGSSDSTEEWNGEIKDFRIWNDVRSQSEIDANKEVTLTGNESNLVLYYKVDEGSGTTLNDNAGSNDATISGATWGTETEKQGVNGGVVVNRVYLGQTTVYQK